QALARKANVAVVNLLAHWAREDHAQPAYEIPALVAVVDDGVDHTNRLLPGIEIQAGDERQPLPVALYPSMFSFDLRHRAHPAGLLYSHSLDFGRIFLARPRGLRPPRRARLPKTDH